MRHIVQVASMAEIPPAELHELAAAMAINEEKESLSEDIQALYDLHLEKTGDEDKLLDKLRNR